MNRFLNWLPTTVVAAAVFFAFWLISVVHLPLGWPRFAAAGFIVVAVVALWVAATRAYKNPNR